VQPDFEGGRLGGGREGPLQQGPLDRRPEPDAFEVWLHEQCLAAGGAEGGVRAMALSIFEEWRLAHDADSFRAWLASGAPSDDARAE